MASGAIQRRQIIEDEALKWGADYANEVAKAVQANKEVLDSLIKLNEANQKVKRAENRTEFLKQQQDLKLAYQETTNALNAQLTAEKNAEKVRQESLNTAKKELDVESKRESVKKRNTQLTIQERVQNEVNNRALKQQARESLGLVGAYEKLNRRRTEAQKRLADLLAAENKNTTAIKRAQREYDILNAKVLKVDRAVGIYTKNIGNYQSVWRRSGAVLSNLAGAFGLASGVFLFAQLTTNIFNTTKEIQSLDLALKNVSKTNEKFIENQIFLSNLAEQYGLELKSLTRTYSQFYISAVDKISEGEIREIFTNISKSASAMGLTVEQQEGAFLALTQMMSKGTVQAEELRGQLGERLPGAFGIMAKAIGVTEQELNKMLKNGEVLAAEVLPAFSRELVKAYSADTIDRIETLTAKQNRLSNSWTEMVRNMNENDTNGLNKFFSFILDGANLVISKLNELTSSSKQVEEAFIDSGKSIGSRRFAQQFNNLIGDENLSESDRKKILNRLSQIREILKTYNDPSIVAERDELLKKLGTGPLVDVVESIQANARKNLNIAKQNVINLNKEIAKAKENEFAYVFSTGKNIDMLFEERREQVKEVAINAQIIKEGYEKIAAASRQNKPESPGLTKEQLEKERKAREKAIQDYIDMLKKRNQDEFELNRFRLEREIYYNQLIVDDEEAAIDDRVNAYLQVQQLQKGLLDNELLFNRKSIALNNETLKTMSKERIDATVGAANQEAEAFLRSGKIVKDATNEQILLYENYALNIQKINDKTENDKQKLIDAEVKIFQDGLKRQLLLQDTALNEEIEKENDLYRLALEAAANNNEAIEQAEIDHQERLFNIKKVYSLKALDLQINELENLIKTNDSKDESERISTEERERLVNELARLRAEKNAVDAIEYQGTADQKVEIEREFNQRIKDLALELSRALFDFADALFQARIANIQFENEKWNEYYDQQIELAGDDERQKDLINKERQKKNDELRKKERKAEYEQAKIRKVAALAEVGVNTATAITSVLSTGGGTRFADFGISATTLIALVSALGAIQAATILATPLPKYKVGRKTGPEELAVTGDGYVSEVLSDPDGQNPIVTPNKPTLTYLKKGQMVHKSIDEYYKFMADKELTKNTKQAIELHYMFNGGNGGQDNSDLLFELRNLRKEVSKGKNIAISNKIDLGYELWRNRNINWRG